MQSNAIQEVLNSIEGVDVNMNSADNSVVVKDYGKLEKISEFTKKIKHTKKKIKRLKKKKNQYFAMHGDDKQKQKKLKKKLRMYEDKRQKIRQLYVEELERLNKRNMLLTTTLVNMLPDERRIEIVDSVCKKMIEQEILSTSRKNIIDLEEGEYHVYDE